jgi:hypothetical protein
MVEMGGRWRLTIAKFRDREVEGSIIHLGREQMTGIEGRVEGGNVGIQIRERISWSVEGRRRVWRL